MENYRNFQFILDDESYFTFSNSTLSGNDVFYSDDVNNAPKNVRFKLKKKYEKVIDLIAISPKGFRQNSYFKTGKNAINKEIYLNECIQKRLIHFIE